MSAISSAGATAPGSRWTLVAPTPGAPPTPRVAWPVGSSPSWRAEAALSSQPVSRPRSTSARRAVAHALAVERLAICSPRGRCGSSTMVIALGEDRLVLAAEQEARSCGRSPGRSSRRADGRSGSPPTRGSNSDRHRAAGELARIEPGDRALAGQRGRSPPARRDRRNGGRCGWHGRAACRRPRRRSRSPSRYSRWPYSRARSRRWWRARSRCGRR